MVHKLKGASFYDEDKIVDEVYESYVNGNIGDFKAWLRKADRRLVVKMVEKFRENKEDSSVTDYLD